MVACTWTTPGTVWATDVWQPMLPVDDRYPYILDVRDLASGYIIESMPLEQATVELVGGTLERLYETIGPPLVIKCDNGSEFVGEGSADMHNAWGVEQSAVATLPAELQRRMRSRSWQHPVSGRDARPPGWQPGSLVAGSPRGRSGLGQ